MGLMVDPFDYDREFTAAGMVPPKDHTPVHGDMMVYDDDGAAGRLCDELRLLAGAAAPHRARSDPTQTWPPAGTRAFLEFTINHQYEQVAAEVTRTPFFAPERKTSMP